MGGKILFGRATDQNMGYVAEYREQSASISSWGAWLLDRHIIAMASVPRSRRRCSTRWRLSSRAEFACSRKPCALTRGRATSACNSARSPRPIRGFAIGSYPFFDPQHGLNTNVVLRARDAQKLAQAKRAVEEMLERVR
jgi:hypothetical protein